MNEETKEQHLCKVVNSCASLLQHTPVEDLEARLILASAMAVRKVVNSVEQNLDHVSPDTQLYVVDTLANDQIRFLFCLPLSEAQVYNFFCRLSRCAKVSSPQTRAIFLRARALTCTGVRWEKCISMLECAAIHEQEALNTLEIIRALKDEQYNIWLPEKEGNCVAHAETLAVVALCDIAFQWRECKRKNSVPLLNPTWKEATERGKDYVSEKLSVSHPLMHLFNAIERISKKKNLSSQLSAFEIFKRLWTQAHTMAANNARKNVKENTHVLRYFQDWIYRSIDDERDDE